MTTFLMAIGALLATLAACPPRIRQNLLSSVGITSTSYASLTLAEQLLLLAGVVALGLMVMEPESRFVLMAVDAIGVDLFVLLLTVQLRQFGGLWASGLDRALDGWYRRIWLPGYRLNLRTAKEQPLIAVYAAVVPFLVVLPIAFLAGRYSRVF